MVTRAPSVRASRGHPPSAEPREPAEQRRPPTEPCAEPVSAVTHCMWRLSALSAVQNVPGTHRKVKCGRQGFALSSRRQVVTLCRCCSRDGRQVAACAPGGKGREALWAGQHLARPPASLMGSRVAFASINFAFREMRYLKYQCQGGNVNYKRFPSQNVKDF